MDERRLLSLFSAPLPGIVLMLTGLQHVEGYLLRAIGTNCGLGGALCALLAVAAFHGRRLLASTALHFGAMSAIPLLMKLKNVGEHAFMLIPTSTTALAGISLALLLSSFERRGDRIGSNALAALALPAWLLFVVGLATSYDILD
jgi:hypothetical protein